MKKVLGLLLSLLSSFAYAGDFDGALDPDFGTDGRVIANFGAQDMDATSLAVVNRHDGKIVIGGSVETATGSDFGLIILDEDGTLEQAKQQHIGLVGSVDVIVGLAVQPDNKIIAVGSTNDLMSTSSFVVVRYTQDGDLDPTFNPTGSTPGVKLVDFFGASLAQARAVAFKRDGRIVVVGDAQDASLLPGNQNVFYAVAVLNSDGSLDNSFAGGAGRAVYSDVMPVGGIANISSTATSVGIQSIGTTDNIVLAGQGEQDLNTFHFQIVRITCDGNLDLTFNNNGVDQVVFNDDINELASGVDIYPDGRIVAVGTSFVPAGEEIVTTRRLVNGGPDNSFNGDGEASFALTDTSLNGNAVNIQNDEKILIAGLHEDVIDGDKRFVLVRYTNAGVLDTTFGGNPGPGFVVTDFGGTPPNNEANGTALQQDGKVVLAGVTQLADGEPTDFAVARYLNDNTEEDVFVAPTIDSPQKLSNCNSNPPILSGKAQNPSNITVYINGNEAGRVITTGDQNEWTFTPAAPLAEGPNTFQVVAEYKSGNMNVCSDPSCCGVCLGPQSCISEAIREKYCPSCIDFPIGC
ncbi:MAG: Ig-like domain-containing protein [Candidatus Dependentiae bacterium]